jgi:MOSC domain-containing protein YiiM
MMNNAPLSIQSVNIGRPARLQVGSVSLETGFFKQPVLGPVDVIFDGLNGDFIADRSRHGGPDQALYLFSAEDNVWWAEKLERELLPGYFGENLTLSAWWGELRVGDRLRLGELLLEVSFPRIPCASLSARVGDAQFLKTFVAAHRAGVYARVLAQGVVSAGQQFAVSRAPLSYPLIDDLLDVWYAKPRDRELLRRSLEAPIAERGRKAFEYWLKE